MSNIRIPRVRTRVKPARLGPNTPIGAFFIEESPDSGKWVKFQTRYAGGYPYDEAQSTRDENHGAGPYIIGGPFRSIKIRYSAPKSGAVGQGSFVTPSNNIITGVGFGKVKYVGGFNPPSPMPGFAEDTINLNNAFALNSPLVPSTSTLDSRVWDKTKPKIEQGGLGVALSEMRDLPSMLQTTSRGMHNAWSQVVNSSKYRYYFRNHAKENLLMAPKGAANHFLNHNFGWVPFIKDLAAFHDNLVHMDDKIRKIADENGQWVKKRAILVNNTEDRIIADEEGCLVDPGNIHYLQQMYTRPPRYFVSEVKTTLAIGVGRFRYYLDYFDRTNPSAASELSDMRRKLAVHGARLSPSNVYKATRWTWLIDWCTDIGKSIQAVQDQALDGMAAKYLFLEHHQIKSQRITQILPFNAANGGERSLVYERVIDVKQRKEADSPFGFGLTWDQLSPKQLSILAALGISRR